MKAKLVFLVAAVLPVLGVAQEPFVRNERVEVLGTHRVSQIEVAPLFLVQTFGKGRPGDPQKVSGVFTFVAAGGTSPITVYDWNATSLSEYGADLPTPKSFCALSSPVEFEIGSRDQDVSMFKEWLSAKYEAWQKARKKTTARKK